MSKSIKTYHYTYIIRHVNGRYYVGRRSTKKDPLLDTYMGSGHWVKKIKDRSTLTKTIIAYYPNIEELKIAEMELIDKYFLDEYCMNVSYSSCGGNTGNYKSGDKNHMYGTTHTQETKKIMSDAKSSELNPNFGRTGELHPRFGMTHTEEAKQLMSTARSGENNPRATITEAIARLIKIRISEGVNNRLIAEEYNTTQSVVNHIRHNRNWKHVTI